MKTKTKGNLAHEVIVIEAAERPKERKLRVAAYVRVSSDSDEQYNSFMAQTHYYTTLIATKENWELVDIYADEAVSGLSAAKRPDFQRLLSDCRNGKVDKILVKSVSRFARNTKKCLEAVRELKAIGVSVCFEEQKIDTGETSGELLTAVFASLAQAESESISKNMRWSYQKRMQSGRYIPSALPDGYVHERRKIVIDEERAAVIRRIFAEYLSGSSSQDIAKGLTKDKIPCRFGGSTWMPGAVRYILRNEKYTGNSVWQKYFTPETLPYRSRRNRGETESYYAENTHEAIISMSDFEAVQKLMEQRRQKFASRRMITYPLRKRIYCTECGVAFRRKVSRNKVYWSCIRHEEDSSLCEITQIPEEEIYGAFLRLYYRVKSSGPKILAQMISEVRSVRARKMLWSTDAIALNKEISEIAEQKLMLTEMNKNGLVDPDTYIAQSNELEGKLRAAKQERERLFQTEHDDVITQTAAMTELLEYMPDFLPTFDEEVFEDLVSKITVKDNNTLRFHLRNGLKITEHIERTAR